MKSQAVGEKEIGMEFRLQAESHKDARFRLKAELHAAFLIALQHRGIVGAELVPV